MPSPIAAIDLIKTALRHIGVLATGETPSADQSIDALSALNDVLERWSIESLAVYGGLPETFRTIGGQATYTMGPGGTWNTDRPTGINSLYTTFQGVDFPAAEWNLDDYLAIGIKGLSQPIVERFVFINDAPLARVILYPTPSDSVPVIVDTPRVLTQVPSIATTMILPPGYVGALQYALAEEVSPQYGVAIDVGPRARAAKALLKRANRTSQTAQFDPALMQRRGNFYEG